MSEVLSQNQIDALFNSLQEGEIEVESVEEPGPKFRKYDFNTPKKFTKDRMRIISSVYENYARIVASHLSSMLRLGCDIELISVEEQRYYEFENALADDNLLSFCSATITPDQEEEDPVMLVLSPAVIHSMLGRMLGGTGSFDEEEVRQSTVTYTEIELAVYETVLEHIIPVMNDVWQNYLDVDFRFRKIETNPKLVQTISVDDVVVLVMLGIKVADVTGQMTVCIPGGILDTIFRRFEQIILSANRRRDSQTQEEKEELVKGVQLSTLEMSASFEEALISLEDVYSMRVGDLINLHIPKQADVRILVEDTPWFKGRLGIYKDNKAVKITGTVEDEEIAEEGTL